MDNKEKRRHARFPINRPGRIVIGNNPPALTQVVNLSESGAALFYSGALARDTPVELRCRLTLGEEKILLTLRGRVRHSEVRGHSYILGVEFSDPSPEAIALIRRYVEYHEIAPE